jgi:PHD/YefM family antitoxin component YafN of YafNO toxin-antitoxin module
METQRVGIREFRDKLSSYLLESDKALAITRHGDTIGYYLPARRKRTEAEKEAFDMAASRLQEALDAKGITEDEVIEDFQRWRKEARR